MAKPMAVGRAAKPKDKAKSPWGNPLTTTARAANKSSHENIQSPPREIDIFVMTATNNTVGIGLLQTKANVIEEDENLYALSI
jgi:hypothetical protein